MSESRRDGIPWTTGVLCAIALPIACGGEGPVPRTPEPTVVETGLTGYGQVLVSPDGRHIAFTAREGVLLKLYIADIDGRNVRRITQPSPVVQRDIVFSPDGSMVAYVEADGPGTGDVYAVPVSGGEPARLTHLRSQVNNLSFSPSGARILFASNHAPDQAAYWVVPAGGGEITALRTDPGVDIDIARWLPDSTKVGLTIGSDNFPLANVVAVLDLPTGRLDRITAEGFEELSGWSPDGTELIYESDRTGQTDLWAVPVAGGTARQLTVDIKDDIDGVYSPDGRWIAYRSERGGQWDTWVIPAAGGDAYRVTNDPAMESTSQWTPDGGALLYTREDVATHLYTVPVSGGVPRLLSPADQRDTDLDISPDGTTVAHIQQHDGLGELWLTPIAGGESRPLVRGSENDDPRWSPDGSMIAFDSYRPRRSVWVVDVATGEERQLSPPGLRAFVFAWSADGARVSFHTPGDDGRPVFMSVPVNGGDATTIIDLDGFPVPSPDGQLLAFTSFGEADRGIFVVPAAGGTPRLLTAGQRMGDWVPVWSSDSRRIAYGVFTEDGGTVDIFVMNADGSDRRRLTSGPALEFVHRWSVDDSEIFYEEDTGRLAAVDVATGETRTIFEGGPSIVGFVHVSPDGETLVFSGSTASSDMMRVDVSAITGGGN